MKHLIVAAIVAACVGAKADIYDTKESSFFSFGWTGDESYESTARLYSPSHGHGCPCAGCWESRDRAFYNDFWSHPGDGTARTEVEWAVYDGGEW